MMEMMEVPESLQSNDVNIKNHKFVIEHHHLGPANPKIANDDYWKYMGDHWGIKAGDARGRLCANCEHYVCTTPIKEMIDSGPARKFKTSMVDSSIVDLESKPVAWCNMFDITCSPVRTCTEQEMGGPIDDIKMKAIQLAQAVKNSDFDIGEFKDPFADTTEEE